MLSLVGGMERHPFVCTVKKVHLFLLIGTFCQKKERSSHYSIRLTGVIVHLYCCHYEMLVVSLSHTYTHYSLLIILVDSVARMSAQRRFQSTSKVGVVNPTRTTFQQNWLSDPATYPIIVVMTGAMAMVGGFSAYYLSCHPDVQISPAKRNSLFRTWE